MAGGPAPLLLVPSKNHKPCPNSMSVNTLTSIDSSPHSDHRNTLPRQSRASSISNPYRSDLELSAPSNRTRSPYADRRSRSSDGPNDSSF